MRRARIKAVATVPVRRKVVQDSTPAAPPVQTDAKESEQLPDKNDLTDNVSVAIDTQEKPIENDPTPQSPQKTPTSPLKTENLELENLSKSQQKVPASPVKVKNEENVSKSPRKAPISPAKEKAQELESVPKFLQKAPVSPVKEKQCLQVSVQDNSKELDVKLNSQPSEKNDASQKTASATVEASPIKIHQSRSHFTRPSPRLDGSGRIRRNSIQGSGASASESEDDTRRSNSVVPNRVRNDSICSTLSLKDTGNVGNISKLNLGQKRRMVVSESARKLAESRRKFLLKHDNKPPDKTKLTMYDLIYYNPVTNPMAPKPTPNRPAARKNSICSIPDNKKEDEKTVDEPAETLVPQVKVGPNGQLIIDEQSLVIDQYKAQDKIDRSDILIDDETSGFYKRRSKSKEWSKWETLKFYKALNTYGTDFLLMQSKFPHRTRQELKLKYKKEEKINHNLVEKALVYQEFDTETLEKDLAKVDENERLETESNKKTKKKDKDKKRKRARCRKLIEEMNCEDDQNSDANKDSGEGQSSEEEKIEKPAPKKRRATRKRKLRVSENNSSNESLNNDSDSNPELYEVQTTRSGRTSRKIKKLQKPKRTTNSKNKEQSQQAAKMTDKQNNNENEMGVDASECNGDANDNDTTAVEKQTETKNTDSNTILETLATDTNISTAPNEFTDMSNMEHLEPGSWVVLTKDSVDEPGKKIIQHYIVSPDYDASNPSKKDNFIPITLPPDVLSTVTNCIQNIEPGDIS